MAGSPGERHVLAHAARRLRPSLNGRRVLLVGVAAERPALRTLVRLAGARVMAAADLQIAFSLMLRFPIDVVVAEPGLKTASGESFEALVRRSSGTNAGAVFVDLPERPRAIPQLRIAHSRSTTQRSTTRDVFPRLRVIARRTG